MAERGVIFDRALGEQIRKLVRRFLNEAKPLSGTSLLYRNGIPAFVHFAVDLEDDGGGTGDATNPADWTYTVTLAGVELATGASPERPRENGTRAAATKGVAYRGAGGAIFLADAYEEPGTGSCP